MALAKKLVEETNKTDTGCISYALHQDISDPLIITMLEEWEDQASIDKHLNSKHFLETAPKLDELCSKQVELNMYKNAVLIFLTPKARAEQLLCCSAFFHISMLCVIIFSTSRAGIGR